jgi:YVTN family beta-propeller protein
MSRMIASSAPALSVIDAATNTVAATVGVGSFPVGVGIIPDIPFSAFSAKLEIEVHGAPNENSFEFQSSFTLGSTSTGINPVTEPVTLQIGTFATTLPPGSFKGTGFGPFTFLGLIDGAALEVTIKPTGTKRFALEAEALDANLKGTKNPVTVKASIGNNSGTTEIKADID